MLWGAGVAVVAIGILVSPAALFTFLIFLPAHIMQNESKMKTTKPTVTPITIVAELPENDRRKKNSREFTEGVASFADVLISLAMSRICRC